MKTLTRRDFLKLGGAAFAGLLLPHVRGGDVAAMAARQEEFPAPAPLGRTTTWWRQAVRKTPAPNGEQVALMTRDSVLPLYAAVVGEAPWPTNPVWYRTDGGYIHSGYVQPVRSEPQPVITEVAEPGFWAEVAVPVAEARWAPSSPYVARKLYYGTGYRVIAAVPDEAGGWWYRLKEGISPWSPGPYVPAAQLRPVTPEALAPIAPGQPDKWIKINVGEQRLTCFHGESPVFDTRVATGLPATATPIGEFRVIYKRTMRRMAGELGGDSYDLPGVPYCTYFTWSGVAIHGTYWHNDYGRRHSHGCVNLTPDAARWVFRWAEPVSPYATYKQEADPPEAGTRVVVVRA